MNNACNQLAMPNNSEDIETDAAQFSLTFVWAQIL